MVKKRNFGEKIDRPPFIGTYKVDILDRFKRRKIDPKTKKVMQETMPLVNGGPIPEFLREKISIILVSQTSGLSHFYQEHSLHYGPRTPTPRHCWIMLVMKVSYIRTTYLSIRKN